MKTGGVVLLGTEEDSFLPLTLNRVTLNHLFFIMNNAFSSNLRLGNYYASC